MSTGQATETTRSLLTWGSAITLVLGCLALGVGMLLLGKVDSEPGFGPWLSLGLTFAAVSGVSAGFLAQHRRLGWILLAGSIALACSAVRACSMVG